MYLDGPFGTPLFIQSLEESGAAAFELMNVRTALNVARVVSGYQFVDQAEHYGPRSVVQHFSSCEEKDIPMESPVRNLSKEVQNLILECLKEHKINPKKVFSKPLEFNDHLILKYSRHKVGLGAHRDLSKYINLIVSITLRGEAQFNIHDAPDTPSKVAWYANPGTAVMMRAPGFRWSEDRPYHSVTCVRKPRMALILKQKMR